jgi:hypothetical protein
LLGLFVLVIIFAVIHHHCLDDSFAMYMSEVNEVIHEALPLAMPGMYGAKWAGVRQWTQWRDSSSWFLHLVKFRTLSPKP